MTIHSGAVSTVTQAAEEATVAEVCDHTSHYIEEDQHWRCLRCGQITEAAL